MNSKAALTILLGIGTVGFVAWRVWVVLTTKAPQYAIVEDSSGSHGPPCASLPGLVAQVIDSPGAMSGSALTVLNLGDQSTANEPRLIGTYLIPTIRRVAEGPEEIARKRASIVTEIGKKCKAIGQTNISPIFLGVKQAVADLRARGCGSRSGCELLVDTDLQETVAASIRVRLSGPSPHPPALPLPIDNAGIGVVFCGYAVTVGRTDSPSGKTIGIVAPRSATQEERLRRTWSELFNTPSRVTFDPYCSDPESL